MTAAVRGLWRIGSDVIRIAVSAALTAALVVGVPVLLLRFVGNPLPSALPTIDEIELSFRSRQVDDWSIVKALAMVVWFAWAHLMASFVVEVVAAIRGAGSRAVRGLGATQWLARKLVAQFTLTTTIFVQSTVGIALPMPPAFADVVPAEVIDDNDNDNDGELDAAAETGFVGELVTVGPDQSLWQLAEEHLGDGSSWQEIRSANVGRRMPDGTVLESGFMEIREGWTLAIPGSSENVSPGTQRDLSTGQVVIGAWQVQKGDHFWTMADQVLEASWGRSPTESEIRTYWVDIISANREHLISPGNNPNVIYADQEFEILLPPLPPDPMSVDDRTATTRPHDGLKEIEQFRPAMPPPPVHRNTDGEKSEAADPPIDESTSPPATAPVAPARSDDGQTDGAREEETAPATPAADRGLADPTAIAPTIPPRFLQGLGVLGIGLGAAMFIQRLRGGRRAQAARRRPGTEFDPPSEAAVEFESRIRPIADHEAVRWLTATNRYLTFALAQQDSGSLPAVVSMRAGELGIEILLDEAVEPPEGFIYGDSGRADSWKLDPDLEVRHIENAASGAVPYAPTLLPVGNTNAGELLVDFGQHGVIGIDGPEDAVVGCLRSIATSVPMASWSPDTTVVAIGVDEILARIPQVQVPEDPERWARDAADRFGQESRTRTGSLYEERVLGRGTAPETIVLVGPGHEWIAQHLVAAAELAYSSLTLVAAAPIADHARIALAGDHATLEPAGLTFLPAVMEPQAIAMTSLLLEHTADTTSIPDHVLRGIPGAVDTGDTDEAGRPSSKPDTNGSSGDGGLGVAPPTNPASRVAPPVNPAPSESVARDSDPPSAPSLTDLLGSTQEPDTPSGMSPPAMPTGADEVEESGVDHEGNDSEDVFEGAEDVQELPSWAGSVSERTVVIGTEPNDADPAPEKTDLTLFDEETTAELPEKPQLPLEREVSSEREEEEIVDDDSLASKGDVVEDGPGANDVASRAANGAAAGSAEGGASCEEVAQPAEDSVGGSRDDTKANVAAMQLGESAATRQRIDEILAPQPVEVHLLRSVPEVEGVLEKLAPKVTSVLGYLAFHRSVSSNALREEFWGASINRSTSDNAISMLRRNVGTTDAGDHRLTAVSDGRITLHEEVGCDWTRVVELSDLAADARRLGSAVDEMAALRAALGLVAGEPAKDISPKNWSWLRDNPSVYSLVESSLVDGAHRLGELARDHDLPELAHWAASQGLLVVPGQEALYRIQMAAAHMVGDQNGVDTAYRNAQRSAEAFSAGEGVQPETEDLFNTLVGRGANVGVAPEESTG